jgi:hypothetical protein
MPFSLCTREAKETQEDGVSASPCANSVTLIAMEMYSSIVKQDSMSPSRRDIFMTLFRHIRDVGSCHLPCELFSRHLFTEIHHESLHTLPAMRRCVLPKTCVRDPINVA